MIFLQMNFLHAGRRLSVRETWAEGHRIAEADSARPHGPDSAHYAILCCCSLTYVEKSNRNNRPTPIYF